MRRPSKNRRAPSARWLLPLLALCLGTGASPTSGSPITPPELLPGLLWTTDLSGDGSMGVADLSAFADEFLGMAPPGSPADFTCDGAVRVGDFAIFARSYLSGEIVTGKCPPP